MLPHSQTSEEGEGEGDAPPQAKQVQAGVQISHERSPWTNKSDENVKEEGAFKDPDDVKETV